MKEGAEMSIYRTNVRFGVSLQNRAKSVSSLNTRYLLNDLNKYLYSDLSVNTPYYGKVCALYGLRRTGKTTMMLQSILGMTNEQFNKTAWIDVTEEDNMASLYLDLQKLNKIFEGLGDSFQAARYHSLAAVREELPEVLKVTAEAEDGEVMAVEHTEYPVYGVQFHPESVMTPDGKLMIQNFMATVHR